MFTSLQAKHHADRLMNIAVTLGELTQNVELCQQIPEYLCRTLGVEPLTLSVIRESQSDGPSLFMFGASNSAAERTSDELLRQALLSIHEQTKSPTVDQGPSMQQAIELGPKTKLQDFPRSTVFAQRIDADHRMLLVLHQQQDSAPLTACTLQELELVAQQLAKLLGCLVVWANQSTRPTMLGSTFERVTAREWAVLRAMESDLGEKQLADQLQLSPHTLHSHVKSLYRRFGVQGRLSVIKRLEEARRAWRLERINDRSTIGVMGQETPVAAAS